MTIPSNGLNTQYNTYGAPIPSVATPMAAIRSYSMPNQSVFSSFTARVGPPPMPTQKQFYWDSFLKHARESWKQGGKRYDKEINKSLIKRFTHLAFIVVFGLALTGLNTQQGWLKALGLGVLGILPIFKTMKDFSKMEEAYEEVKRGNPRRGDQLFRQGLEDISLTIQDFYRPMAWAGTVAFTLSMFKIFRPGEQLNWFYSYIKKAVEATGRNHTNFPIRQVDGFTQMLERRGEYLMGLPARVVSRLWAKLTGK